MKKNVTLFIAALATCWGVYHFSAQAAEGVSFQNYEFATIQYGGDDKTHVIRPNGTTEFLEALFTNMKAPEKVKDRAFYLNVAMNAMAKEGYEFAGMESDRVVMKRAVGR